MDHYTRCRTSQLLYSSLDLRGLLRTPFSKTIAEIYSELRRDLQLLREKRHTSVFTFRLQTQRIMLEPKAKRIFC